MSGENQIMKTEQEKRLSFLVEAFKADSDDYQNLQTPEDEEEKRRILRSLMNIRMPKEMSSEVLQVQDEYLKERADEKGVTRISDIPVIRDGLSIWQGDITSLAVDAIVNAANSQMLGCFVPMHTCIDNCIHTFAGVQLRAECNRQMEQLRRKHDRAVQADPGAGRGLGKLLSEHAGYVRRKRAEEHCLLLYFNGCFPLSKQEGC